MSNFLSTKSADEIMYSCRIPYVSAKFRTKWHSPDSEGPFAVLIRGSFKTKDEAIRWGKDNLNGTPYSVVSFRVMKEGQDK